MGTKLSNLLLAALLVVVLSAAAMAQPPRLINFQGRVLDATGAPVADGNHSFDFRIYNASAGGTVMWSELSVIIATTDGLLTYALGTSSAIPTGMFASNPALYLAVTVDGQMQTPRSRLITVPYAQTSEELNGLSPIYNGPAFRTLPSVHGLYTYLNDGRPAHVIHGTNWTQLRMHDGQQPTNVKTVELNANSSSGGQLRLFNSSGANTIDIHGGQTGNTSVEFPTDAIDADEMYNEPGIAHSFIFGGTNLTAALKVIDSIVVNVPTAGYLNVTATGFFQISHTIGTGTQIPRVEINEIKSLSGNNFTLWTVASGQPSESYWNSFSLSYVKSVSAGQTIIYLIADAASGTSSSISRTHLIAKFYPTAYGAVDVSRKTPGQVGISSVTGAELVPAEIYDASLVVIAELEAEKEALRAENQRLRDEQPGPNGQTPNNNQ